MVTLVAYVLQSEFTITKHLSHENFISSGIQKHQQSVAPNPIFPSSEKDFKKLFKGGGIDNDSVKNMSNLKVFNIRYTFSTKGEIDFVDLTNVVQNAVSKSGVKNGLVHIFAPHATGILILTENEYGLLDDIKIFLEKIIPKHERYKHPSNAHSHLRSMLLPPDKTMPVVDGHVEFGTWQSLIFVETDVYPRKRTVIIQVLGM